MKISKVVHDQNLQLGPAGLVMLGEMARAIELDSLARSINKGNPQITIADILRTMIGLLAQGKADFDHVKAFIGDKFFMNSMGIGRVPSAESYRQKFQDLALSKDLESKLPKLSVKLWKKTSMKHEFIEQDNRKWVRVDIDPVIYDNADTKKEGVAWTHNNQYGFAPIFAHFAGGWMINAKLNPGDTSFHGPEATSFILESLDLADRMSEERKLLVMDCGFDSKNMLKTLVDRPGTDFIIKHNRRRESLKDWQDLASKEGTLVVDDKKKGYKIYHGSTYRELEGSGQVVRLVYEVKEISKKKGQLLLAPLVKVFSVWTSLEGFSDGEILKLYRVRGTSEQFHSEFKSEMDMERLPSGKFKVNSLFMLMGMLTYNMLKVLAQDMVIQKALGLKKASRRRIKTVMNSVIFLSCRLIKGARTLRLKLGCSRPWHEWFTSLFMRLKQV